MVTTTTTTISCRRPKNGPSFRDFELYRFVKIERHSTREAAEAFGVSQTRVRQILDAIIEYLTECVPFNENGERVDRLQVAEQLAREQLEYLYGQAIEWWRRSVSDHRSGNGLPKASYLALAARITMCMARVPVHEPPRWGRESGIGSRESEARAGETPASRGERPPVEDCSLSEVSRADGEAGQRKSSGESALSPSSYELLQQIETPARREFLRPAQSPALEMPEPLDGGSGESLSPNPAAGPSPQRPLNRQERRARQRQLERILKKRPK